MTILGYHYCFKNSVDDTVITEEVQKKHAPVLVVHDRWSFRLVTRSCCRLLLLSPSIGLNIGNFTTLTLITFAFAFVLAFLTFAFAFGIIVVLFATTADSMTADSKNSCRKNCLFQLLFPLPLPLGLSLPFPLSCFPFPLPLARESTSMGTAPDFASVLVSTFSM